MKMFAATVWVLVWVFPSYPGAGDIKVTSRIYKTASQCFNFVDRLKERPVNKNDAYKCVPITINSGITK